MRPCAYSYVHALLLRHNRHRTGRSRSGASQLQETKQPRAEQPCTQQPGAKQPVPPHRNQEQSIQARSGQAQSNQAYSQKPRAQQPGVTGSPVRAGGQLERVGSLEVGVAGLIGTGVVLEVEKLGEVGTNPAAASTRAPLPPGEALLRAAPAPPQAGHKRRRPAAPPCPSRPTPAARLGGRLGS